VEHHALQRTFFNCGIKKNIFKVRGKKITIPKFEGQQTYLSILYILIYFSMQYMHNQYTMCGYAQQ